MKLKLNRTLRAALIAAITAVGFTLTQAQAADATVLTTTFSLEGTASNQWTLNAEAAEDLDLATSGATLTKLIDSSALGNKSAGGDWASQLSPNTNVQNSSGWILTFTVANNGDENVKVDSMTVNSFLFNNGGAYQSNQTTRKFMLTMSGGEQTMAEEVTITGNSANNPPSGVITFNFADSVVLAAGGSQTFSVKFDKSTQTDGCFVGLTSVTLNKHIEVSSSTWKGTEGNNNWTTSTSAWDPVFTDGNEVVFGTDASYKTVEVTAAVNTAKVTVEDNYTINIQTGGSMTVGTDGIVISTGKTLTIANESGASHTVGTVSGAGNLALAKGAFSIGDFGSTGKLVVTDNGTLALGGNKHTIGTLEISNGGVVTTTHSAGDPCVTGDIVINAGGTFKVIEGHDAFGYNSVPHSIIMTGEAGKLATLELNQNTGYSATFGTALVMHGYATVTSTREGGSAGFNTYNNCSIAADGVQNNIDVLDMRRDGVTVTVAKDGDLTIKKVTLNNDSKDGTVLVKAGEGLLSLTDESNLSKGLNVTAGTVDLSGAVTLSALTVGTNGTLRVSGGSTTVGGTNTISNTVSVTGGALALNGTFDLSGISHEPGDVKYYKDANPGTEPTANGFARATVEAQLISGNTSSVTIGQDAVLILDGVAVTYDSSTGKVVSNGELSLTTYYINENSETLSEIQAVSPTAAVTMAGGTTLNVDANMAAAITVTSGTGIVNINEGKTVTGTKSNITLAGAGAYVLDSSTKTLGQNTSLDSGWTGEVVISNADFANDMASTLNNLRNGNLSWVRVKGLSGWNNSATINANLILENATDGAASGWAYMQNNGNNNQTVTYAGKIKGDGKIGRSNTVGQNQTYVFTGDISGWTGTFEARSADDRATTFRVGGDASVVNANVVKESGVLNVEVQTNTVFNATVTASLLNIAANKSATFNGTATFGSVIQNAGAAITVGTEGALTIGGGSLTSAITNNGTVSLTGVTLGEGFAEQEGGTAYYALDGSVVKDTANHYIGTGESYVQVVNNAENATSTGTAMWKGTSHELNANGRIITGAGEVDYTTFYVTTGESLGNIKASEHGGALAAVNVSGGALVVNQDAAGIAIKVTEEGTITGEYADASKVGIDSMATASYTGTVAEGGISITPGEGKTVSVTNYGEDVSGYTAGNGQLMVSAENGTLTMTENDGDVVVNNYVDELGNLVNTTGNALTLSGQDVLELNNMNITGSTVGLTYVDLEQKTLEGTVSIVGVLEGGKGTLLADLTFKNGSTLDVDGGAGNALTLGSTLTFDFSNGNGALVNLDDATIAALGQLQDGEKLALIVAKEETELNYGGNDYDGMSYSDLFNRADGLVGDYKVYAKGDAFGLMKSTSPIPEPTTGTLSLLALAGLCARRRKK